MKILLHHRVSEQLAATTRQEVPSGCSLVIVDPRDTEEFDRQIVDTDVLWHVLTPIRREDIARAERLKLIHKFGVGVDTIDRAAARQAQITVCNMPGVNQQAVAEMTLGLILTTLRRIPELDRKTRDGQGWTIDPDFFDCIGELGGRTVGFLGYGQIPQSLSPALTALGARVLYHRSSGMLPDSDGEHVGLDELLERSDVLSLHLPLTDRTTRIIDEDALRKMKPGSILVNTGRGALVDEDALVDALRSGQLAAAGLDVFATSPLPDRHPLLELPNVTLTPHVSWLTRQTWERCVAVAVAALTQLLAGQAPTNRVG